MRLQCYDLILEDNNMPANTPLLVLDLFTAWIELGAAMNEAFAPARNENRTMNDEELAKIIETTKMIVETTNNFKPNA